MGAKVELKAEPRTATGKGANRKLRATGRVPAVVYGHGEQTRSVSVDAHALSRLMAEVHVESTIIDLDVSGEAPVRTLVREIQSHPYRGDVLHIDFYQIHAGEAITLSVPLRFVGAAPGVKAGGMLSHAIDEVEVRCLPDAIPDFLEVDISALDIGDSVHVDAIPLPEGVELLEDAERTVCSVLPPTVVAEAEPEEVEEVVGTEPEVIGRRKEEDEDEE